MGYSGKIVTPNNYNLFTREERLNAQKELKAYLKGKDTYRAKVFLPDDDGGKWVRTIKKVNRG